MHEKKIFGEISEENYIPRTLFVPDIHENLRIQVELHSVIEVLQPGLIPGQLPNVELFDPYDHKHSHVLHADVISTQRKIRQYETNHDTWHGYDKMHRIVIHTKQYKEKSVPFQETTWISATI